MDITLDDETNKVQLDEARRQASHQEVEPSIDVEVQDRIKRESGRVETAMELTGMAHEFKQESAQEAIDTEREIGRGRTAARISQFIDYLFYVIYGLTAVQFLLRLIGARSGNGFVQFMSSVTRPLLAPFERIMPAASNGTNQIVISYLLALIIYILIHLAINGVFRFIAHRKVTV